MALYICIKYFNSSWFEWIKTYVLHFINKFHPGFKQREINTGYICSFKLIQTCILSWKSFLMEFGENIHSNLFKMFVWYVKRRQWRYFCVCLMLWLNDHLFPGVFHVPVELSTINQSSLFNFSL
jgi:hypothetical protein